MAQHRLQDRVLLLRIFPAEIWQGIINEVKDIATDKNLLESSSFLASFLPPSRAQALQKAAGVQLLLTYLIPNSTFTPITTYTRNTFFNCRLVCRVWRFAVDSFLEQTCIHVPSLHIDHPAAPLYKYPPRYLDGLINNFFCEPASVGGFYQRFLSSHNSNTNNPFLCRAVSITVGKSDISNSGQCLKEMIRILDKWGHQIWYVNFRLHDPTKECYECFRQFMNRMPNLKALRIMVYGIEETEYVWKNGYMATYFPHYKKLEYVKSFNVDTFVWGKFWETNSLVAQVDLETPDQLDYLKFEQRKHPITDRLAQIERKWEQR